ncbi:MAG: Hpt domain-containing protein, partial [Rhodanobacteraceae bacterium]
MNSDDNQDFTTLSWVKRELDETLGQAREALEAYVDDPSDEQLMRECARDLHQVHGTLRMVEMYGAAMVVEEMESLAHAVMAGKVDDPNDAYGVLMRGLVQTPDYLERIQSGHRDIPVVLLPLLNDLRAARGENKLSEAVLFAPNLNAELPNDAPGAEVPLTHEEQSRRVSELRAQFQLPLLAWMRKPDDAARLSSMRQVLDQIAGLCHSITGRRLWWIAAGVLEGLERHELEEQRSELRPLIGRVDRAIKQLIDGGELALAKGDAEDLTRQMLYYVAQAHGNSDRLVALRKTYALDDAVPDEAELEHAHGAMSGHNRALLDTVSGAIKEDLLRVKDALDIFLRKPDPDAAELEPQVEVLDRVSDTLGMLGLPVPSRVIDEQHQLMQSIVDGSHPHDESTLLDVAGALLYVESSLDDHIENLGTQAVMPMAGDAADEPLSAEARRVHDALMSEAAINLTKVKQDITAFIETPWDHKEVGQIPALLEEIGGAMRMLDVQRPADLLNGISRFVHNELIVDRRVPTAEQMEKLADALASFEYFLEAAREHRAGRDRILDVTQQSLAAIGYWPVPEMREPSQTEVSDKLDDTGLTESVSIAAGEGLEDLVVGEYAESGPAEHDVDGLRLTETETTAPPIDEDQDWIEIEEQIEEQVAIEDDAIDGSFQAVSDEIDEDIREVFVEEFEEEIAGLDTSVMAWKQNTSELSDLKNVRRTFHTLKGSGRLVGALGVGEFSWKVENMLNRVLDGTIQPNGDVVALVEHAVAALPDLLARLKGEAAGTAPIAAIMKVADKLAEGESARVEDIKPAGTRTVVRTVKRRVPRPAPEVPTDTLSETGVAAADQDQAAMPEEDASAVADEAQGLSIAAPVLPPIDPVLLDILRSEVEQHIGVMREFCDKHDETELPVKVRDTLLRSVHTLSGAVAMVDIPILVQILAPLENYLKRLRAHDSGLAQEGLDVLSESSQVISDVMQQFDSESPQLPECSALVQRISGLRDSLPEPPMAHTLFDEYEDRASDEAAETASSGQKAWNQSDQPDLEAVDLSSLGAHGDFDGDTSDAAATQEDEAEDADAWLQREVEGAAADLPDTADDDATTPEALPEAHSGGVAGHEDAGTQEDEKPELTEFASETPVEASPDEQSAPFSAADADDADGAGEVVADEAHIAARDTSEADAELEAEAKHEADAEHEA